MARVPDDEFKPTKDDMVFDAEEQAVIDAAVAKMTADAMAELDKIEKTW